MDWLISFPWLLEPVIWEWMTEEFGTNVHSSTALEFFSSFKAAIFLSFLS